MYSLVKDILRAANALGTVLWKEMETERTYRDPGGAGQDENQEIGPKQAATEEEMTQGKSGKRVGPVD